MVFQILIRFAVLKPIYVYIYKSICNAPYGMSSRVDISTDICHFWHHSIRRSLPILSLS